MEQSRSAGIGSGSSTLSRPESGSAGGPGSRPWSDATTAPADRARSLLAALTLEEKVAQLGSDWQAAADVGGDVAPMQDAFTAGSRDGEAGFPLGLGQLTRIFGTAPVTVADGIELLRRRQAEVVATGRLGIPALVHEECLTGFTTLGATVYPAAPAWAATFDPELVETMGAAIGSDLRAVGAHQGLAPVLDVVRDYRWGRVEETLGEDPYLVATMGTAYVRGLQRPGIVATLKHFAGYAASRGARNHAPVTMGPREFTDMILPPFEMAVRVGGVRSVMNSYTDVDGVPCAANPWLLTEVLRDRWGFTGTVVSDYWAITFLATMHRTAADPAAAGVQALRAGLDVELPNTGCFGAALVGAVRSGAVSEDLVDRAALRVLRQKAELGLLDPDWTAVPATVKHDGHVGDDRGPGSAGSDRPTTIDLDSPANRAIARRLAEESVILLENSGTLPLRPAIRDGRIAVVGPCADDAQTFMGCYSFPNHVLPAFPELGMGLPAASFVEALRTELPSAVVEFQHGCPIRDIDRSGLDAAAAAARGADVCIAVVGDRAGMFGRGTSGEGCDASDLALPGIQAELLERVLGSGTPVVVIVVSGRPYALGAITGRAAAIVQAFMPGEEGGGAIAGVLSGRIVPSGRLPLQVPRDPASWTGTYLQPPLGRANDGISNLDPSPLFPFGYGLSYTTFGYSDLTISSAECPTDGAVDVAVTITNEGGREADEVVQLYLGDEIAEVTRPVRQLVGYRRLTLAAGGAARVVFTVHADRTSFTGIDLARIVEPGAITVEVGRSAADLPLAGRYVLTGPRRMTGSEAVLTTPARVAAAA